MPMFTPGRFARLIEIYGVGTVFVVPAMAIQLLNAGVHERHDFSSVKLLGSTAASLPPSVAAGMAEAFPKATIVNYYTSTEAAPAQTVMIVDPARPASVGRPSQGGDLRILLPDGTPAGKNETGEVWLRIPRREPRLLRRPHGHRPRLPRRLGPDGRPRLPRRRRLPLPGRPGERRHQVGRATRCRRSRSRRPCTNTRRSPRRP